MLDRMMRALRGSPDAEAAIGAGPAAEIVASIPPALRGELGGEVPITPTYDAFLRLFSSATRCLKLFVPYVDPSFTALVAHCRAPVRVLTTVPDGRGVRTSPVLERCATVRDLQVRYLNERRSKSLIYQVHAKLIIADGARAYVGSANMTDTSIHYNLELGVWLRDAEIVGRLERLFDRMYDRVGVPSKLVG